MGYLFEFEGQFTFDKPLDDKTYDFLFKLSQTRRMKRKVGPEYGVEGEFYVDGPGEMGEEHTADIIDYNKPPATQPSLWCWWRPTLSRSGLEWNGNEKFSSYIEWLEYIISKITAPKGYILNGMVSWQGEEEEDVGTITVTDNVIEVEGDYD